MKERRTTDLFPSDRIKMSAKIGARKGTHGRDGAASCSKRPINVHTTVCDSRKVVLNTLGHREDRRANTDVVAVAIV